MGTSPRSAAPGGLAQPRQPEPEPEPEYVEVGFEGEDLELAPVAQPRARVVSRSGTPPMARPAPALPPRDEHRP